MQSYKKFLTFASQRVKKLQKTQKCAKRFGKHKMFNVYLQQIFSKKCPIAKIVILRLNAKQTLQKIEILHFSSVKMTDFSIKAPLKDDAFILQYRGACVFNQEFPLD